ncbi:MAG: aldehyde ferredoxin oxidoreductase N-terminal domain-containing protein, partial [Candidatus Helarchaeota archaeon]
MPLKFRLLRISLDPSHLMSGLPYGEEEIPNDILRQYIGGKGIGTKILWDEVGADVDPLSPKNKLIFVTGPATGTKMATANRYGVLFKSPLTGIYAESYSGGYLAPKIRASGFDIIIIEGRAHKPVYIVIEDGKIEYKNAKDLWGKTTYETEDYIKETEGSDFGVLCIGPAGENLVK